MRFNGWHQSSCLNCGEKLIRENFWFLFLHPITFQSEILGSIFGISFLAFFQWKERLRDWFFYVPFGRLDIRGRRRKKHENWYYSTLMSGKRDKTLLYLFQFYLFVSLLFICSVFLLFYVFRCAKKKSWQFAFSHINFFLQTI